MLDIEIKKTVERYVLEDGVRIGEIEVQPESGEVIFSPLPLYFYTIKDLEEIVKEMERVC